MAKKKKKKNTPPPPPRHNAAAGRPQRALPQEPKAGGPGRTGPVPRQSSSVPGVPGADAFQNLPKRRPPSHLPGAEPEREAAPSPRPGPPTAENRLAPRRSGRKAEEKPEEPAKPPRKRRPKKEVSPARRRRNRRRIAVVAVLVLIVAGLGFSLGVLFKIERFSLQGEAPYTQEEILQVFGQKPGDNIFSFSAGAVAENIEKQLPYIEDVTIRRRLPGTVVLRITPAVEAYCMPWEGGWVVLSEKRKVLRLDPAQPEGLTVLFGVTGVAAEPGSPLAAGEAGNGFPYSYEEYLAMTAPPPEPEPPPEALPAEGEPAEGAVPEGEAPAEQEAPTPEEEAALQETEPPAGDAAGTTPAEGEAAPPAEEGAEAPAAESEALPPEEPAGPPAPTDLGMLGSLLDQLAASGLENISWVDVSDPLSLRFCWEDRITVELGARSSLPEKLKFAAVLLTDTEKSQITPGDRGVLSLTGYPDATDRVWFTPA